MEYQIEYKKNMADTMSDRIPTRMLENISNKKIKNIATEH